MRVYNTYRNNEFARGVARHLIETLAYTGREVWLVSPWLKDVRLPVGELGHFASVLGSHFDELSLSDLLARVAERHTLHVITKPPAEFVPFQRVVLLDAKLEQYAELTGTDAFLKQTVLVNIAATLRSEIEQLVREIRTHEETFSIGRKLEAHGAKVYYLERLHAKVTWTSAGAFIGSANFTNGGFFYNDELILEVTDDKTHAAIYKQVQAMTRRAQSRSDYNLTKSLPRFQMDEFTFFEFANNPLLSDYPELKDFMNELSFLLK